MLSSLQGLNNISEIGGLLIEDNQALNDLTSLSNVTSEINSNLRIIGNPSLKSLKGIDKLNLSSVYYLFIHNNDSLSECAVYSVCNFMDDQPYNGYFYYNGAGCSDSQEVIDACDTVSVDKIYFEEKFSISPNPFSGSVNLQFTINDFGLTICDLFNMSGIKVQEILYEEKIPGTYDVKINLDDIPAGIYFCTFRTEKTTQTEKIIKL